MTPKEGNRPCVIELGESRLEIEVDTFNFTKYGLLRGAVLSVSRDAVRREAPSTPATVRVAEASGSAGATAFGQELSYTARVGLAESRMMIDGKPVELGPGMTATAEIKTSTRRIIEYVLSPLLRYRQESLRERQCRAAVISMTTHQRVRRSKI